MKRITIALVGDFDEKIHTHVALNESIDHCRTLVPFEVEVKWIPTVTIEILLSHLSNFHGVWIAPGSPYKNDHAVYQVISVAREMNIPIIGSCGGFQYMILEYAKNVLKISTAGHEESEPGSDYVISKLACSLKGLEEEIEIRDKSSWLYHCVKVDKLIGKFYCSYSLNPAYQHRLDRYPMIFTAFSPTGEVRAFELKGHRFFNGTLFQPTLDSSEKKPNPLIVNFFKVCAGA